ncbi:MAG: hypothetical protein DRM99_03480 [Thermoplasmata archaeon]|nr:MAG: hypothetical protein DRM99_03480 [Thermoplasmata archaeon]
MKKETRKKLEKFLEDRRLVRNSRDIGLIVLEKEREISPKEWRKLDASFSYFLLNNPFEFKKLVNSLIKAQKEDKIFLLEIKADPNDKIIQVLKQICHFGQFNIHDKRGKLINTIKVEPGSIVVIAERDFINKEISYPRFYNIFDTALII